jgi:hypothetical protein
MYFLEEPYVSIRSFFEAGGNVLWGIFVVTMLMWALIVERVWFFRANMPHIFRARRGTRCAFGNKSFPRYRWRPTRTSVLSRY